MPLVWIFGNGAVPFIKQYNDYGLKAALVVPMANNFSREQLAELGDLGLGMVACDFYADTLDNPANAEFVAAYQKLYPGEYPMPQGFRRLAGCHDVRQGGRGDWRRHHAG